MTNIQENWLPIKGFEGRYEISDLGRVLNIKTQTFKKPTITKNGYNYILLWRNNKFKHQLMHRLLAIHFIPNLENKPQVNHKDGIKLNNSLSNLEWVTHQENAIHAYKNGLTPKPPGNNKKGIEIYNAKVTESEVMDIRRLFADGKYTQKELGIIYGMTRSGIQRITKRITWKHI